MTTIYQYTDCSTAGLIRLDFQLIAQIERIAPGVLVRFDHFPVNRSFGCHPYLQAPAARALELAIAERPGVTMQINSSYRTIAQQAVLFNHLQKKRCGIMAAARPGFSNHNSGLSIDVDDAAGWKRCLEFHGWDWLGSFDPMHFDYKPDGAKDLRFLSIKAFQQLWNLNNPVSKLAEDGKWGTHTYGALVATSVDGFRKSPIGFEESAFSIPKATQVFKPSLRFGAYGLEVKEFQSALTDKGFKVEVDGVYGEATQKAVREYQISAGLVADGVVGVGTRSRLGLT